MSNPARPAKHARLGLTAALCAIFVAGMVGMSFAAVPLYRIFCELTGYGGTTQRASAAPDKAIDRWVTVRFDSNIGNGLGWSFRPVNRQVRVKVGAVAEVAFRAENRMDRAATGMASFNVTPAQVGAYFNKLSCFCFEEQTLAAGETLDMPVVFFVDPAIAADPELDRIDTITLSYTFFPAPDQPAAPKPVAAASSGKAPL
jgi:cytochrome c oxidase assembly protein subunit 11